MPILKINNLTKKYGDFIALNQINFEIKKGEVYGFIGPNGAGKTTTIRLILGLLKANQGNITIFGKDAWSDAVEIHRNVAYVPGEVNLWPNLTGGEVIDLLLSLRGSGTEERKLELIKKFNLDPTKKCRTYSKGNRQKVALIAAFASDAELYIFDEPTSGLDPLMEKVFHECVVEAKNQGKSVLLSSHILSEVEKLCDKISIIRDGKIVETGTLEELRHLTRTNIILKTEKPINNLSKQKGVRELHTNDDFYHFQVETDELSNILKYISNYGVISLVSSPPTLEDLFMHHYNGDVS